MLFPINTKNFIEYGKCEKTTKVIHKEKNMNSDEAVQVDISETGMQMIENRNNKISAVNNVLEFNDPVIDYFNRIGIIERVDPDGTVQWDLGSEDTDKMESIIFSDISREDYAFWSLLTDDPTFLGLKYTENEIKSRLIEAGIKTGFFNVTIGDKSTTQFFSQGKGAATVYSKEQYDSHYKHIISVCFLR
ncbi:MAG: hypothetical protein IKP88_01420 [Lachnospiraceae bacterium]|nr:hypothetical protein [Lachnospiraceae bacterium]